MPLYKPQSRHWVSAVGTSMPGARVSLLGWGRLWGWGRSGRGGWAPVVITWTTTITAPTAPTGLNRCCSPLPIIRRGRGIFIASARRRADWGRSATTAPVLSATAAGVISFRRAVRWAIRSALRKTLRGAVWCNPRAGAVKENFYISLEQGLGQN